MADKYIKLQYVLNILDAVMSDKTIKRPGKAIRKRLKYLPFVELDEPKECVVYFDDGWDTK